MCASANLGAICPWDPWIVWWDLGGNLEAVLQNQPELRAWGHSEVQYHHWEGGLRPGAEWEVAASSWDGGRGTTCPACWSLARPPAPPCTPVGSSLASRGPHAGGREDNVRWGRRCADNQLKTFRTQEVSFAHNKSNWSPAHKPCQIVLLMVRPDSKTNFQKFMKHFLQWYPIWSYICYSLAHSANPIPHFSSKLWGTRILYQIQNILKLFPISWFLHKIGSLPASLPTSRSSWLFSGR